MGELVRGRCGATNRCDYCSKMTAIENTEMLWLDAMHGVAPTHLAVLTSRSACPDPSKFYKSRELVYRDVKQWWPDAQAATLLEFTPGEAPRSGGLRRPHWNLMWKGVPLDEVDQLREVIVGRWCAREDALPVGQYVEPIRDGGGLAAYLAQHFQKQAQAPPKGWTGHRFRTTRGYLWLPTPEARSAARRSLQLKRELYKAHARGLDGEAAERAAQLAMAAKEVITWELVQINPTKP